MKKLYVIEDLEWYNYYSSTGWKIEVLNADWFETVEEAEITIQGFSEGLYKILEVYRVE